MRLRMFFDDNRETFQQMHVMLWVSLVLVRLLDGLSIINIGVYSYLLILFGISVTSLALPNEKAFKDNRLPKYRWLLALFIVAFLLRAIPYIQQPVPLGYDPGFYKYVFDHPFSEYSKAVYPLAFSILMAVLSNLTSTGFWLTWGFVLITSVTSIAVYYAVQKLSSNSDLGLFAAGLFVLSLSQYDLFSYNYMKNAFGIIFLLITLLYFDRMGQISLPLIWFGGLVGGFHRPAFLLLGITYLLVYLQRFREFDRQSKISALLNGALILGLALLINFDRLGTLWGETLSSIIDAASKNLPPHGGNYISVQQYISRSAFIVGLALPAVIREKNKTSPAFLATVSLLIMVVLQIYFFRRFILYLDIFLVIFAAKELYFNWSSTGTRLPIKWGRNLNAFLLIAMLISVIGNAIITRPYINSREFNEIQNMQKVVDEISADPTIVVADGYYAPWVIGWVDANIVAPGLYFDERPIEQWEVFWNPGSPGERLEFLSDYQIPILVLTGDRTNGLQDFSKDCFQPLIDSIDGSHPIQLFLLTCKGD